ncbi:ABC transporter ATP-binding protein [Myroides injenensis]|uniref:ABC transporter ATP-binding protein n=1 Tax=Myroides injenensis TaxID=1183151 RepID=UPI000289EE34|nr:ABC transporter ATP-binding protein [Myroides injenensis]
MSIPILKTENLAIGYCSKNKSKQVIVQSDLNISLKQGALTALLGINGIGKSTLLRTLNGVQLPIHGQVTLNNRNINSYTENELAQQISIVLTEKIPISNLTVYELIKIGRTPYLSWNTNLSDEDHNWINKAISLTNLEKLTNKSIHELSDGQLQRVLIARAIAQNTSIIILDEPTNHLDLHHKVSLIKLLKKLAKEENKAILFSAHDIDIALQLSDEIIILQEGYNVQGTSDELINKGIFNHFFPDDNLTFNPLQKRFELKID